MAIHLSGSSRALATMRAPVASSPSRLLASFSTAARLRTRADAAAGHDALFDGGPGGRQGVLDAVLLLLELDLGGGADPDDGHAAGQLGQALLELLAVPVGVGVLDLALDLGDPALHVASADRPRRRSVVSSLVTITLRAVPSRSMVAFSSFRPISSEMTWAAGEHGQVLEHGLAALTEARRLHRHRREGPPDLVHDQGGERLAVDVLGDEQQGLARLHDLLEHGHEVVDGD